MFLNFCGNPVVVWLYVWSYFAGKVAWRREESVAYSVAIEMVDLPVSENQAKFEDEFGSHEGKLNF